jgi:hypothetical protein
MYKLLESGVYGSRPLKPVQSVLIADVIHSSRRERLSALLAAGLRRTNRVHLRQRRIRVPYAVTAGDEFQTVVASIEMVPGLILDLRRRMRPLALRIGIGIGEIQSRVRPPVNRLVGEAFANARAAITDVKEGSRGYPTLTAFRSSKESFDRLANLVYGLNDTLVLDMTEAQWRALNAYVEGGSVERAARLLRVSVSTLSRNLKRSHFRQLADTAETMESFFRDAWA